MFSRLNLHFAHTRRGWQMCRWRDVIAGRAAPISLIRTLFSQNQHETASTSQPIVIVGIPALLSQSLPSFRYRLSVVYQKSQNCYVNWSKVWIQLTAKLMCAIYSTAVPFTERKYLLAYLFIFLFIPYPTYLLSISFISFQVFVVHNFDYFVPVFIHVPRREAGDVWCLPPVWNLRDVIWFHFAISSLVLLLSPVTLSILSFSACWCFLLNSFQKILQYLSSRDGLFFLCVYDSCLADRRSKLVGGMCNMLPYGTGFCFYAFILYFIIFHCFCPFLFFKYFF